MRNGPLDVNPMNNTKLQEVRNIRTYSSVGQSIGLMSLKARIGALHNYAVIYVIKIFIFTALSSYFLDLIIIKKLN